MSSNDAPPSYDSVVQHVTSQIQAAPTDLKNAHEVIANLTPAQRQAVLDHADANAQSVQLTAQESNNVAAGMANAIRSAAGEAYVKTAATNATNAVNAIELLFNNIHTELASIDNKYADLTPPEGKFAPRLENIRSEYRGVVYDSRKLAIDIASYGKTFSQVILPFSQDTTISVEKRQEQIQNYINKAKEVETSSGAINTRFQGVKLNITNFTSTFGTWATARVGELNTQLQTVKDAIAALQKEISDKRIALLAVGGVSAASLPIAGCIAAFCGPAAPVVLLVGVITAAVTAATCIGLVIAINNLSDKKTAKEKERDGLTATLQGIQTTQQKLNIIATEDLTKFKENIDVLASFWTSATADAQSIQAALTDGLPFAEWPKWLQPKLDDSAHVYEFLAAYLTEYAKGIDNSKIPKE